MNVCDLMVFAILHVMPIKKTLMGSYDTITFIDGNSPGEIGIDIS